MIPDIKALLPELVKRLRARRPFQHTYLYGTLGGGLVNPDGPEAAATIERLSADKERLEAENERLSKAVCSGILGDLLTPAETDVMVDFIKQLRGGDDAARP